MLVPYLFPWLCHWFADIVCRQTQKDCFSMKSTSVGMSLINALSVGFIVRNERYASTPSVYGMLIYREFTSMVTNKYSGFTEWLVSFSLQRKSVVCLIKLFTCAASTPLRKDTAVFVSFGRFLTLCFIGLTCHNYALNSCFVYKICKTWKPSFASLSRIMICIYIY